MTTECRNGYEDEQSRPRITHQEREATFSSSDSLHPPLRRHLQQPKMGREGVEAKIQRQPYSQLLYASKACVIAQVTFAFTLRRPVSDMHGLEWPVLDASRPLA